MLIRFSKVAIELKIKKKHTCQEKSEVGSTDYYVAKAPLENATLLSLF